MVKSVKRLSKLSKLKVVEIKANRFLFIYYIYSNFIIELLKW
jgi:hypothetical protein